jgi:aspartate/methionine/tyrosine aminotransferase
MNFPVEKSIINKAVEALHIKDLEKATIREVVAVSDIIEKQTGLEFIRMEMGVPGLPASAVGVEAEIEALKSGVASIYPPIDGIPELKAESSRFIKAFVDLDIDPECCVPVVGSMEGSFVSFLIANQCNPQKDTILFIDPGFPVQKQQATVLGYRYISFDVYDYRGDKLKAELEKHLSSGAISCMIYSNPNNPGWFCFREEELRIIGESATEYDVPVIEDLAYFAMDFRKDLGKPFEKPFQASVGRYTDNYILLISGSKAFSYAGQRIAIVAISNSLYQKTFYDTLCLLCKKERYS